MNNVKMSIIEKAEYEKQIREMSEEVYLMKGCRGKLNRTNHFWFVPKSHFVSESATIGNPGRFDKLCLD